MAGRKKQVDEAKTDWKDEIIKDSKTQEALMTMHALKLDCRRQKAGLPYIG